MTGRERVKAALTFKQPDRAPRDLWSLPYVNARRKPELEALLAEYPTDLGGVSANYPAELYRSPDFVEAGDYKDEWGSIWSVAEPGVVGEVKRPALADWSALTHFKPPWELIRRRDLSVVERKCEQIEKFVNSECTARIFERLQFLRGTENLFIDIAYGTQQFRQLLDLVHEYYLEDIRQWCGTSVDSIMFMDDWGSNQRLLIQPKTWREIFKPLYRQYCDLIHSAGKFAFFHSDGNIQEIYGDLIDIGIDALNSQLFTMDIEMLGRLYKGKITFWGEIDRQYVLPFGTKEEVRQAVKRVRRALDDGQGGVFAQCEWGKFDPKENIATVFQTWLEPLDQV